MTRLQRQKSIALQQVLTSVNTGYLIRESHFDD